HDMHGNVAEWTRSAYRPYPYSDGDGRNEAFGSGFQVPGSGGKATGSSPVTRHGSRVTYPVVRGGSWYDRPRRARSSWRLAYPAWQGVYDVGFRVIAIPSVKLTRQ
ncbi:SUMF1/EgtB/PvdO family nonheme iron enzyme, partial [bacterium]|nr:SUMF1/EgtB/PvdO family nonheme iron enzyme [bacterium]